MRLRSRLRILAAVSCVATVALLATDAHAASTVLWPGVTHARTVQFTNHGPVVLNVIAGPRPGGLTTLEPLLSNDSVLGRETVSSMQRRVADGVTAGVNADFSRFDNGRVSGIFMRHGDLAAAPNARRSSVGVLTDGTLDVRKIGLRATWAGTTVHPLAALNDPPTPGGAAVYTTGYGTATPSAPGSTAAVLFPFPLVTPGVDLTANVVEVVKGGAPVPIPLGGAVLSRRARRGPRSRRRPSSARRSGRGSTSSRAGPGWRTPSAAGRSSSAAARRSPARTSGSRRSSFAPRAPRSAVGQLPNGRIILVAVDGRQPGYSIGPDERRARADDGEARRDPRHGASTAAARPRSRSTAPSSTSPPTGASGPSAPRWCSTTRARSCRPPSRRSPRTATASATRRRFRTGSSRRRPST